MTNASIYAMTDGSNGWAVERCEPDNDGVCHKAVFYGPDAARQARTFKAVEYGPNAADALKMDEAVAEITEWLGTNRKMWPNGIRAVVEAAAGA